MASSMKRSALRKIMITETSGRSGRPRGLLDIAEPRTSNTVAASQRAGTQVHGAGAVVAQQTSYAACQVSPVATFPDIPHDLDYELVAIVVLPEGETLA